MVLRGDWLVLSLSALDGLSPDPGAVAVRHRPDRLQDPGLGNDLPFSWVSPPTSRHDSELHHQPTHCDTMTAIGQRLERLRPLSSATDLTDFTHSTLEPDVRAKPMPRPATRRNPSQLMRVHSRIRSRTIWQTLSRVYSSVPITAPHTHSLQRDAEPHPEHMGLCTPVWQDLPPLHGWW